VYVEGAPFTKHNVLCGFVEEVDEITELFTDFTASNFVVNLKGHGCLIMANNVEYLTAHTFVTGPFLEYNRKIRRFAGCQRKSPCQVTS
jgi:hypothetical protein